MSVTAVDCDLHKLFAWDSEMGLVVSGAQTLSELICRLPGTCTRILFEIASEVMYRTDRGSIPPSTLRWALWNSGTCGRLNELTDISVLVSPSHVWTRGYPLKVRHRLARADAKNKDLRECQTMLWSHKQDPSLWVPYPEYMDAL